MWDYPDSKKYVVVLPGCTKRFQASLNPTVQLPFLEIQHTPVIHGQHKAALDYNRIPGTSWYFGEVSFHVLNLSVDILSFVHTCLIFSLLLSPSFSLPTSPSLQKGSHSVIMTQLPSGKPTKPFPTTEKCFLNFSLQTAWAAQTKWKEKIIDISQAFASEAILAILSTPAKLKYMAFLASAELFQNARIWIEGRSQGGLSWDEAFRIRGRSVKTMQCLPSPSISGKHMHPFSPGSVVMDQRGGYTFCAS